MQKEIFLAGAGTAWIERNKDKVPLNPDPVMDAIRLAEIKPTAILEVGCGNGWRVKAMQTAFPDCYIAGIDPAIGDNPLSQGTADQLDRFFSESCDLIIYGFCLYLCDREDLFKIVAEGDRVLKIGGHLVIHDFFNFPPYRKIYEHDPRLCSYHMDYPSLWMVNPQYVLKRLKVYGNGTDVTAVTILTKQSIDKAWPLT